MRLAFISCLIFSLSASAQLSRPTLEELSKKINATLPEIYDHATKLMATSVSHNNFEYHFIVGAGKEEFDRILPKVRTQVMNNACKLRTEKTILTEYKANLVYRYENEKGQSLGEFMIRPEHCLRGGSF